MLNTHIFKLLTFFAAGIFLASQCSFHWVILFTLWSTAIISLLILIHFGRQLTVLRKWIGVNLLITFLFSGAFSYEYSLPSSQKRHFSQFYLKSDKILAEVEEVESDTIGYRKMIVEVNGVYSNSRMFKTVGELLCYVKTSKPLDKGDLLLMSPRVLPIKNKNNPGEFDASGYWKSKGVYQMSFAIDENIKRIKIGGFTDQFWQRTRASINKMISKYLSQENRSVASALVLGDKSGLSGEKRDQFANAGAMHVLAVSGMHVGILLGFLQWLFYNISFLRKRGLFIIMALMVVWSFAFITGLSSSVFRATLMFTVLAIGQLRGYSFFSLNALFVSGLIILFIDPMALFSIGFQLSFLAMMGISFFFKPLQNLVQTRSKILNYFWDGTALGIAAQLGTIPISLYYFHQFPNYFILTNLGLIILAGASLIAVIILLALFWMPVVSDVIGLVVDFVFTMLNGFISWINELPATISKGFDPSWYWVVITYLGLSLLIFYWNKKRLRGFIASLMLVFSCGVMLIYQKEQNIRKQELVFLNHSDKVMFVKTSGKVLCIYAYSKMDKNDVQFITKAYSKKMGVDSAYQPLKENQAIQIGKNFRIQSQGNEWKVDYYGKAMRFTPSVNRSTPQNVMVIGHGIEKDKRIDETTIGGAVIIPFNDKQS